MHGFQKTLIAAAVVLMTGCSTMSQINHESLNSYDRANAQTEQHLRTLHVQPHKQPPPTLMSDLPYVNTHAIQHKDTLPALFAANATLNAPRQSVWGLMHSLAGKTGLTVDAGDDLLNEDGGSTGGSALLPPAPRGAQDSTLSGLQISPLAAGAGRSSIGAISYQGTVKGLLDQIAGQLDATWRYSPSSRRVHFFRYETRSFHIATVPGDAVNDTSITTGASSGVQGGQGQMTRIAQSQGKTQFGGKLSVWKSLEDNVKPMLSSAGSLNVNQSTASITVHDRWDRVAEVAKYVELTNKSLTTQVEVTVTVYRVTSTNADNRGVNLSLLYNALGQQAGTLGLSIATPRPVGDGLSSLIVNTPVQRADGTIPPLSGSQFFLDALSTLGKASVVTNASVSTVNNMPAPFKVVQTTAYVAETTSLLTSGGIGGTGPVGAGATLTPGQVETGFAMQVLPSVQPDGHRMLLQIMLSISTLDSLANFTSGGNTVQLPQVSSRELMPRVWIKSGQALVLAGFQSVQSDHTIQTPLDKSLWALGGNRQVNNKNDSLVIVITPVATAPQTTI